MTLGCKARAGKRLLAVALLSSFLSCAAHAQTAGSDQEARNAAGASDRGQIEKVLRQYQSAYEHNDYAGVVKVWPSLEKDKKASKKLKERLDRADISQTKLSLAVESADIAHDTATVEAKRAESYVQVEETSYSSGDNMMGSMPSQNQGPTKSTAKKNVKKSGDVWIVMKRDQDGWVIDSMSDKKPK